MEKGTVYTVIAKGVGKPDYSEKISSGITRLGTRAEYREQFKMFGALFSSIASVYPWVVSMLAPGASAHLVDQETGLATPYSFPAGYALSLLSRWGDFSQDCRWDIYMDGQLVISGIVEGGIPYDREDMLKFSSLLIDPTAASAHSVDMVFTNMGSENLYGGVTGFCLLKAMGTPEFPSTKITKCPFCGNQEVRPVTTTQVICSACGKLYIVYDLSRFKGI